LLLVRSCGPGSPGMPVSHGTVTGMPVVLRQVTVTRTGSLELEWTSDVAGLGAVVDAGPGIVSRRGRAPIQVGLVGARPGTWSPGAEMLFQSWAWRPCPACQ
jgi:hypothetical protein